jgi:hypothetical protein
VFKLIKKNSRHDIAEILLRLAVKHQSINQSINHWKPKKNIYKCIYKMIYG